MRNLDNKSLLSSVEIYIISVFIFYYLAYKSIKVLLEFFTYGIFKKEILSEKSNLGFDLKIIIK